MRKTVDIVHNDRSERLKRNVKDHLRLALQASNITSTNTWWFGIEAQAKCFRLFLPFFLIRLSFYALQLKLFMASFGIFLSRLPKFLCKRHRLQHTKALGITFHASVYQFARQRRRVQVENLQALAQVLHRQ